MRNSFFVLLTSLFVLGGCGSDPEQVPDKGEDLGQTGPPCVDSYLDPVEACEFLEGLVTCDVPLTQAVFGSSDITCSDLGPNDCERLQCVKNHWNSVSEIYLGDTESTEAQTAYCDIYASDCFR
jgi:hypothetical protein